MKTLTTSELLTVARELNRVMDLEPKLPESESEIIGVPAFVDVTAKEILTKHIFEAAKLIHWEGNTADRLSKHTREVLQEIKEYYYP